MKEKKKELGKKKKSNKWKNIFGNTHNIHSISSRLCQKHFGGFDSHGMMGPRKTGTAGLMKHHEHQLKERTIYLGLHSVKRNDDPSSFR